jgi:hypothetical protein
MKLVLDEQRTAAELRDYWLTRRQVRLTLGEGCAIEIIVGRVSSVSVTGSSAVVDGWMVPTGVIREIARPTLGDLQMYSQAMHDMRAGS